MLIPQRKRKGKRTTLAKLTPIAQWIERRRLQTIDPRTGEPYSERQLSLQIGLDVGAINRYMHGAMPVPSACTKIALFFSTPERKVNPDYLMVLSNQRFLDATEYIEQPPPEPEPLTDDEADAILRAWLGDELYGLMFKMIQTPGWREVLSFLIRRTLGEDNSEK